MLRRLRLLPQGQPPQATVRRPTTGRRRCWRHAAGISLLTVVASLGFASAATAQPLSAGCEALNDPAYDAQYDQESLGTGMFFSAGERITITASNPSSGDPTEIFLLVFDAQNPSDPPLSTEFPGTVAYTLPFDNDLVVAWSVGPAGATATFEVSCATTPPDCSAVTASPSVLKADAKLQQVTLSGATDPEGGAVTYLITGVTQDEPTTGGFRGDLKAPDANGLSANKVSLRGERNPSLNGRVYRIAYTVTDEAAFTCSGIATVGVAAKKGVAAVDDGEQASWNSFTGALMP